MKSRPLFPRLLFSRTRLSRTGRRLAAGMADAVQDWRQLAEPAAQHPVDATRWVVVDVESSGLDPRRDQLISVGAIAVCGDTILLADSFEVILQQDRTSAAENILVHGIGAQAQETGTPAVQALIQLLGFIGKDRLVAFHAAFDETLLVRAMREHLGLKFRRHWFDLAYLCPALCPDLAGSCASLDDWLGRFGIANFARHNALSDALATAQLLLICLDKARHKGITRCDQIRRLEKTAQRLSGTRDILSHVSS
jgi:DNA polymerase III subunit epsilon